MDDTSKRTRLEYLAKGLPLYVLRGVMAHRRWALDSEVTREELDAAIAEVNSIRIGVR